MNAATAAPSPGPALTALLEHATAAERQGLLALLADWTGRLVPIDAAERACVEAIVAAIWRAERLVALEARVVDALTAGEPAAGLPSLAALARFRARLDRERIAAERLLGELYRLRPAAPPLPGRHPARLAWLAARLREGRIRAASQPAAPPAEAAPAAVAAGVAGHPTPERRRSAIPAACRGTPARPAGARGTSPPEPVAALA